jgi:hypothetical protein
MTKKQFLSCRIEDELIDYIDSIKHPYEERSSCLRRIIHESKNRTENVEKIVESILIKMIDRDGIKEVIKKEINENYISLNENLMSSLRLFSDHIIKLSNSFNEMNLKQSNRDDLLTEINEQINKLKNGMSVLYKDVKEIKKSFIEQESID